MAKRRKKIKYKKERVVLADILPYEVPITFSNRHFYNFLVDNKIKFSDNCLYWKKDDTTFNKLIEFIFNFKIDPIKLFEDHGINKYCFNNSKPPYSIFNLITIPFAFKISHKQKEFRELVVIHPLNQVTLIDFYNKYRELLLYYCSISPYSIRKPHKVARYTYFNDYEHRIKKVDDPERDIIEIYGREYENLKTFFTYKDYSNIHKFYESYTYQRNEKKFNKLFKFDIAKCFDSIYTHSMSWGLTNKEIVKENVNINRFTFGGVFDTLMQKLNYNETNGIIIGPEFSRIFAEIILQQIDYTVNKTLESEPLKIKHKSDFSVFRYVDDYFLFYNDDAIKERVFETFQHELKKYNFHINESKKDIYEKPIITELTIAKERISNLLNKIIELKSEDLSKEDDNGQNDIQELIAHKYSLYFNSKRSIIDFKIIIKETSIEYKSILNYTLAIVDRKLFTLLKKYDKAVFENDDKENSFKDSFIKSIVSILDFVMFLYSVSPRVNTTIKLSIIFSKLIKFINQKTEKDSQIKYFNKDQRNLVFKKIFDDVSLVLNKNSNTENTQVESLYLLIILKELGREYRLDKETLKNYLNITYEYEFPYYFNYWSITVLLFYIRDLKRYNPMKEKLLDHIKSKYNEVDKSKIGKHAELVILSLDLISCPYIKDPFKKEILNLSGIDSDEDLIINKIKKQGNWFTKWSNFDFEKELNTKRSQEVY